MRPNPFSLIGALPLLLLSACGDGQSDYNGPAPASGPVVTAAPEPPVSTNILNELTPSWSTSGDANSVTLTLVHVGATPPTPVLSMTCERGAVLRVEAPLFSPDPSLDHLQIGAADVIVSLPVVASSDEGGVTGEGPAFRALLSELTVGRRISLSYGAQSLGPLPPAPDPLTSRFADRCRGYLEPRAY